MQTFGPTKFPRERFEKVFDSDIIRFIVQLEARFDPLLSAAQWRHMSTAGEVHDTENLRPSRSHSKIELLQFSNSELTENHRNNV